MNIEQLEKLNELREKGIISQEQFETEKEKILHANSDEKSCDSLSKPKKINWKNFGISSFIAVIYFIFIFFQSDIEFDDVILYKQGLYVLLNLVISAVFTLYAIKINTYKYENCAPAWFVFFVILVTGFLGVWIVTYQFLQIKTGFALLKKNINKRNKILTNIGITILLIIVSFAFFILYSLVNSHYTTPSITTSSVTNSSEDLAKKLHSAVLGGEIEEVNRLIANGADINISKDEECYLDGYATPLLLAINDGTGAYANKDSAEIAKILIESGADINVICNTKSGNEVNPLSLAIDDIQILKLLIKAGANVNAKLKEDRGSMSMLVYALYYTENPQIITELLKNGADYNDEFNGNKISDLCLYITDVKKLDEKYNDQNENFIRNCNTLLQFVKEKDSKALQNNSVSSVILPEEFNQLHFKNIESNGFQALLREGIEQYLIKYLKETGNQPYSGNLGDYIDITPYIPLPQRPVVFNGSNVEFIYVTYEIAAGYIGPISFSIPKSKLNPFLTK